MTTRDAVLTSTTSTDERTAGIGRPAAAGRSIWAATRDAYRSRRAARAAYARAEQELSSYTTHADLLELSEMLHRSNSSDTIVYRDVVDNMRFRAA